MNISISPRKITKKLTNVGEGHGLALVGLIQITFCSREAVSTVPVTQATKTSRYFSPVFFNLGTWRPGFSLSCSMMVCSSIREGRDALT